MKRMVIRPRIQTPFLVVLFTLWGLLGMDMIIFGSGEKEWAEVVLGAGLVVTGGLLVWRSLRLGAVIDADGIRVRGLDSRDQVTPWHEVRAIECDEVDARAGLPIYGPVIHLNEDDVLPVRALGSYRRLDAERKVAELRSYLPAAAGS